MSNELQVGVGLMRQRQSLGDSSSGDDIEDDEGSRSTHHQFSPLTITRTWVEVVKNALWIASAAFITCYGDGRFNLVYLLGHDNRIRRLPLYLGMLGVGLNALFFLYKSVLALGIQYFSDKWEISSASALPLIAMLGLTSFGCFSFALWPIWGFLTLPLVFTLFMACMVILPYWLLQRFGLQI